MTTIRNKAQRQPSRKRQRSMILPTITTHGQDGVSRQAATGLYYVLPTTLPKVPRSMSPAKGAKNRATEIANNWPHDIRGRPSLPRNYCRSQGQTLEKVQIIITSTGASLSSVVFPTIALLLRSPIYSKNLHHVPRY